MKFILGLDPGIASIGWALILEAENDNEQSRIIDSNVVKVDFDNFAYMNAKGKISEGKPIDMFRKGLTVSPNLVRRQKRGAHRKLQRYKQRRADLIALLRENGFIDGDTLLCEDGKGTTYETLMLRSKAAREEISLSELARVLLMINKKRGYKSIRKGEADTDIEDMGAYLAAITGRSNTLVENHQTVGQYLMNQLTLNPLKGIKRQTFYRKDYEDEFEQIWKTQMAFHPELTRKLKKEIKNRIIFFQRPIESKKQDLSFCELESHQIEVEKNGKKQLVTTGSRVCPISSPLFQEFRMWQRLNDVVLTNTTTLEQYALTLEQKEMLAAELSIRKELTKTAAIKLLVGKQTKTYDLNFDTLIGNETQTRLVSAYLKILEMTGHDILDIKKMKAQDVLNVICKVFEGLGYKTEALNGEVMIGPEIYMQPHYKLWHLLYSFPGDNSRSGSAKLVQRVKEFFGFDNDEYAKIIADVKFPDGYRSLSAKAIQKLLPFLKEGYQYNEACEKAGYNHSKRSITKEENESRVLHHYLQPIPHNSLRNPLVERVLNQMVSVVNGLIDEYGDEYGQFNEIRIELARDLSKNAESRRRMTQDIENNKNERAKCRQELIDQLNERGYHVTYVSENDILKYRLYKELAPLGYKTLYSKTKVDLVDLIIHRKFDKEHIIPKAKSPSNAFSVLTVELSSINEEKGDMTALDYVKWKYGEAEAQQYIARVNDLFKKKAISKAKKDNLLRTAADIQDEPLTRDLGLTQYINRKAYELLGTITRKVVPTTGSITSRLRDDWQLVDVLQELVWDKYDKLELIDTYEDKDGKTVRKINEDAWTKRTDHRNHAMDAITVAFTKPAFINYLNSLNAEGEKREQLMKMRQKNLHRDKQGNWRFNEPMPLGELRAEVKQQLERINVYQKPAINAVTPNLNISKSKKKKEGNRQIQLTPRGKLHDDTYYGSIMENGVKVFTKRVEVNESLNVNDVVDKGVQRILQERLREYGNKPKEAFSNLEENPIWFNREKGIRIKRVIVRTKLKDARAIHKKHDNKGELLLDKDGKVQSADYVRTNNNHHVAIYEDAQHELHEVVVSFFDAVDSAIQGNPVIDMTYNADKGWRFLFSLQQNDCFVFPDEATGFNPADIDLTAKDNYALISPHLFKVQAISEGDYRFRHQYDATKNNNAKLKNMTWKRIRVINDLKGAVKVRITKIGHIEYAE
ncbi:type II CRISPR RNA-guided endonuclease Cas9 [Prevotella communis]|uniref:type II CRISPR RNA-guided endonuclease Cas9 n=1 Tax=Prevotella communis TaxID=2913614 RepID=UPI001EDA121E|nr:type II CRISPR RNA-guided endonuclease Cas9 [Prevotella communis]UKK62958.1 type II CRISPR RNA-guided endonuclease Cas9 [Prevotella communis]UKK65783.1 type II CRISPR RNA-guided endonuclease Cas9 [Prevotella communis]